MPPISGAIALLRANNRIVGKANDINIDPNLQTDVSEEVGKYHANEVIYTAADLVRVSFTIERWAYDGLVSRGLWPDTSLDSNITNFQGLTLEVQDKRSGVVLHKVTGWKPTGKPVSFRKGVKSVYQVSGVGIKEVEGDK